MDRGMYRVPYENMIREVIPETAFELSWEISKNSAEMGRRKEGEGKGELEGTR